MSKVVMPKNSALLEELEAVLQIYYEENDWLTNDEYKTRLKSIIGDDQYSSSYTKKAQITSYFGFTIWEDINNPRSKRRITSKGRDFYLAIVDKNLEKIQELLLSAIENVKFGRENFGCPDSDSDIEPPALFIRAIIDLNYLTYKEFAYLLWELADNNNDYAQCINELKNRRASHSSVSLDADAVKYTDAKPIMALIRWGLLQEEKVGNSSHIKINGNVLAKYMERLKKLNIYNTEKQITIEEFSINNDETEAFESLYETVDEYHEKVIREAPALDIDSQTIIALNKRAPEHVNTKNGRRFKTDPRIIKAASKNKDYSCVVDSSHLRFQLPNNGFYVEGHHIIPMKAQKDFDINLDCVENIAVLCPFCHKAIHYAQKTYKKELLNIIYDDEKQKELNQIGISISLDDLLSRYY